MGEEGVASPGKGEDGFFFAQLADYCLALNTGNHLAIGDVDVNATLALSNRAKDFMKSPRGTMIRIEVVVLVTAASLLYLSIFGSRRRKSSKFYSQAVVLAAYTLFPSLISNALGSMQSSLVKSSMYPIWAISLYLLFSDSITAYKLIDHRQSSRLVYRFLLDSIYMIFIAYAISATAASPVGFTLVYVLYVIALQKFVYRLAASGLAVSSSNFNKMVADHMDRELRKDLGKSRPYDPVTMGGYHYLVDWPLRNSKLEAGTSYATESADAAQVIDIESVFSSKEDKSLSPQLKDTCLSFSLCHLLRRRFYGFACSESGQQKTRDFVFKGLLRKTTDGINYDRVFKVIEVELAFTYDFFFTKRAVLYYGSWAATFWSFASACLMSIVIYLTATSAAIIMTKKEDMDLSSLASSSTVRIDYFITLVMLASIVLLEVLHQLFFWTSIWGRVSFVCQRVREEGASNRRGLRSCCTKCLCIKFKEILVFIGVHIHVWTRSSYWQNKLGQYSLLESVDTTPGACSLLVFFYFALAQKFISPLFLKDFVAFLHPSRHDRLSNVRKPGKPIELDEQVKEALVNFLDLKFNACGEGKIILTNGRSSLASIEADDFFWNNIRAEDRNLEWAFDHKHWGSTSCKRRMENQVYYILTWHIATWYCEMGALKYYCVGEEHKVHLGVATKLSRYCAYLVAFAPKLLRGHHYDTKSVFDAVAAEAFESLKVKKDKYDAMTSFQDSGAPLPGSIFEAGVRLARILEKMAVGARWKVLADFWTEMTLYVAKSGNNMEEHIEHLAKGGEFITHLWALLFHAGIVEQEDVEEENHGASV